MRNTFAPSTLLGEGVIAGLQRLIETYADSIELPPDGRWSDMTDCQIWLAFVVQVSVVGSAASGDRVAQGMAPHEAWYESLVAMNPEQRRASIHEVLRTHGVRYAMEDARACRKTGALVKNLATLIQHGGPRAYIERLARWPDERARVSVLIREMAFIKNKGARDLLIGLGLLKDALAFDTRVLKVLATLGAQLPDDVASNSESYGHLEAEIIERVCRPAGITGAMLDRIMFQRYAEIVPRARGRRSKAATADCA